MSYRLHCVAILFLNLGLSLSSAPSFAEAQALSGTFVLKAANNTFEHDVPDCSLTHFHLPKPPPEGQMFQLEMLSSQSSMSGSRIMLAGFFGGNNEVQGTFAYRDEQDQQWLPSAEDFLLQHSLSLSLDGKSFNAWVDAADRTKNEYLVDLRFDTTTPLTIFTNTGMEPVGDVTVSYQGQCALSIPWLLEAMDLQ